MIHLKTAETSIIINVYNLSILIIKIQGNIHCLTRRKQIAEGTPAVERSSAFFLANTEWMCIR